ncbi:MAG: hypothetical protein JNM53_01775, partial [Gemmatimonadetes bacterium]|nr:hypothetical protein [Gemmatimonadota bacterium]
MKKKRGGSAKPAAKSAKPAAKGGAKAKKAGAAGEPPAAKPRKLTPVQQILINNQSTKKPRRGRRETSKTLGVYDADRDILDQYLYEVSQTPLLTTPQEIAIAKLVREGDQEAMQELVK